MYRYLLIFAVSFVIKSCAQQNMKEYNGEWVGVLPNKTSYNLKVTVEPLDNNTYHLTIGNDKILIDKNLESSSGDRIRINVDQQLFLNLERSLDGQNLSGFIKTGRFLYRVDLDKVGANTYTCGWNLFMFDNGLQSDDVMLYVEQTNGDGYVAYPFFGDQRFRGTWTEHFQRKGDTLLFRDGNSGLNFRAQLLGNRIDFEVLLVDEVLAKTSLTHTTEGWEYRSNPLEEPQNTNIPEVLKDGWKTADMMEYGMDKGILQRLIDSVNANALVNTHSILIAKENKLVFETYFDGFNVNIPHDLRSASKSISSAIIGIAIDEQLIKGVDEKLIDFIPQEGGLSGDSLKSKIRIKDLLTMSSGLDVNDSASENHYQDPSTPTSWLQTVLAASMVKEPGTYADYGSANPFLLGVCLAERLDVPLEDYMHEKLFAPLGITNYINQTDDSGITPYFGGGMLLTPRDLLKFGQLYLNDGEWNGEQVISKSWVAESFGKYVRLQDYKDKNEYGYLWWHDTYTVNEKNIKAIEARGAGGQFIFILPELNSVVVITSGNFRNRKGNQPRDILKEYILPSLLN